MLEFLTKILPNLMANKRYVNFGISIVQTLQMTLWSGAISFVLGLAFGIILVVTKKGAIPSIPSFIEVEKYLISK